MLLDNTSKSVEIVLGGVPSSQLPWLTRYDDGTSTTFDQSASDGITNSGSAVTMIAAPGSGVKRCVKFLSVFNLANAAVVATIQMNNGSSTRTVFKATLNVGDNLVYTDTEGFKIVDSTGSLRAGIVGATGLTGGTGLTGAAGASGNGNRLFNSSFRFAARQNPSAATTVANGKYSADRWRLESQGGTLQYSRTDNSASPAAGNFCRYAGNFNQSSGTQKFMVQQPIEAVNGTCRDGTATRYAVLSVNMKAGSAGTYKIGLIQLGSGGTTDTIAASIVTAWNSNATDPTLATNYTFVTPIAISNTTVSGGGGSCAVTTSWQTFSVYFVLPTAYKNLIPVIWTDSQVSTNLQVSQADFYFSDTLPATARTYSEPDYTVDQTNCLRYFQTSYDEGVVFGTATTYGGAYGGYQPFSISANTLINSIYKFLAVMRAVPTMVLYNPNTGATGFDSGGSAIADGFVSSQSTKSFIIAASSSSISANALVRFHFTADAEM